MSRTRKDQRKHRQKVSNKIEGAREHLIRLERRAKGGGKPKVPGWRKRGYLNKKKEL